MIFEFSLFHEYYVVCVGHLLTKGIWERSLNVEHKSILSILGGVFDFPLRGGELEGVYGYLQASGGRKAVDTRHRQ